VKARLTGLPLRAQIAIALGVVLLYAAVLWFVLVAPKRAEAASLSDKVIAAQLDLASAQLRARRPAPATPADSSVSDVLRLAKAMPSSADQAGLVLELDRLARSAKVTLGAIAPQDAVIGQGGATTIPVVLTVTGSYRQITRFLQRTRALVNAHGGAVHATGRLLTMQSVELVESKTEGFPFLDATITLNAFVYDGPIAPPTPPPTTTTTEDSSGQATAAGSTP
jgi:Tfp pilus assembly protein PilO